MRRKLSPWGWAAAGALSVLVAVWLGTTVYTVVKQSSDENRITRIEERVVGLGGATQLSASHRRSVGGEPETGGVRGGATQTASPGHQHSSPSSKGGGGNGKGGVGKGGSEGPAAPKGGGGQPSVPQEGGANGDSGRGEAPAPPSQAAKPNLPATVEAAGEAAGEVAEKGALAAEGAVCGTVATPGCSK